MKAIWKWMLQPETTINIPHGAKILTVQEQYEIPRLWALVDTDAGTEVRTFRMYGTGHVLSDDPGQYIGTVPVFGGRQVFHVFETTREE